MEQGRLHAMREVDRECEARLYQLRVQQDLGVGSTSARTVKFRRTLEDVWCSDFKQFLWNIDPNTLSMWRSRPLDADSLMEQFDFYRSWAKSVSMRRELQRGARTPRRSHSVARFAVSSP